MQSAHAQTGYSRTGLGVGGLSKSTLMWGHTRNITALGSGPIYCDICFDQNYTLNFKCTSLFVLGSHWLPLSSLFLVDDDRELIV